MQQEKENMVSIRAVHFEKDAQAVRDLYVLSLQNNTEGFVQDLSFHGDIMARAEKYRNDNGDFIGLYDGDRLIGFGGLLRHDDENVELCKLHLHPDYQGKGLGKKLSITLLEKAKDLGYRVVQLHVTATQKAAIGLYGKLGFEKTDRRFCHVKEEEFDTVFMEKLIH